MTQGSDAAYSDSRGQATLPLHQALTFSTNAYEVSLTFDSQLADFARLPVIYNAVDPAAPGGERIRAVSDFRGSPSRAVLTIYTRAVSRAAAAAGSAGSGVAPQLMLRAVLPHNAVEFAYHAPYVAEDGTVIEGPARSESSGAADNAPAAPAQAVAVEGGAATLAESLDSAQLPTEAAVAVEIAADGGFQPVEVGEPTGETHTPAVAAAVPAEPELLLQAGAAPAQEEQPVESAAGETTLPSSVAASAISSEHRMEGEREAAAQQQQQQQAEPSPEQVWEQEFAAAFADFEQSPEIGSGDSSASDAGVPPHVTLDQAVDLETSMADMHQTDVAGNSHSEQASPDAVAGSEWAALSGFGDEEARAMQEMLGLAPGSLPPQEGEQQRASVTAQEAGTAVDSQTYMAFESDAPVAEPAAVPAVEAEAPPSEPVAAETAVPVAEPTAAPVGAEAISSEPAAAETAAPVAEPTAVPVGVEAISSEPAAAETAAPVAEPTAVPVAEAEAPPSERVAAETAVPMAEPTAVPVGAEAISSEPIAAETAVPMA
jgi:hypothetical protein